MKQFFTSDLHFDHANITKYCPDSRGHYLSIDEMNANIIKNINSEVTDNDQLFILGDIAFCKPSKAMDFLKQINGQKFIVFGNHDESLARSPEFQQQSKIAGVEWSGHYLEKTFMIDNTKINFVMMHYPIASFNRGHYGAYHLHGHLHSTKENKFSYIKGRRTLDVGVDGNDMRPYNIADIHNQLSKIEVKKYLK